MWHNYYTSLAEGPPREGEEEAEALALASTEQQPAKPLTCADIIGNAPGHNAMPWYSMQVGLILSRMVKT